MAFLKVEPEGQFLDQFILEVVQYAMVFDSLASSHQISVKLESPNDITQIFNQITYMKSASVIHMMKHFISKESFQQGLQGYLKMFAYSTARQDQLWQVMTDNMKEGWLPQNVSVKDVMDSWTLQVGYPVITVTRDYLRGTAVLTQDRFLLSGNRDNSDLLWWVPVSYTTQFEKKFNDTQPKLWLPNMKTAIMQGLDASQWLLLNLKRTGFYRVNYDDNNWKMIIEDYHQLPEIIRAQLLNDALSLARAGFTSYTIALNLTQQISNDESYFCWASVKEELTFIHDMLINTPAYMNYSFYLQGLLQLTKSNLTLVSGNLNNDLIHRLHKGNMIALACKLEYPPVINQIQSLVNDWMIKDKESVIDASLKSAVYCAAIANGNSSVWEHFWKEYINANGLKDKVLLLEALGCSKDEQILSRYLHMIIDPASDIRKQDGAIVFIAVADNKYGYHLAFEFLFSQWHNIQEYFGSGFGQVSKMVDSLSKFFNTQDQINKLHHLQSTHMNDLRSTSLKMRQTIERVRTNYDWFQSHYFEIQSWLQIKFHSI
uniref:Aminopeptidase N n=1 Tax=Clastoptera arizonana TaxID=38151 RepID=A0A1B6CNH7_9HEMI